jgi:hypothetical protein
LRLHTGTQSTELYSLLILAQLFQFRVQRLMSLSQFFLELADELLDEFLMEHSIPKIG